MEGVKKGSRNGQLSSAEEMVSAQEMAFPDISFPICTQVHDMAEFKYIKNIYTL